MQVLSTNQKDLYTPRVGVLKSAQYQGKKDMPKEVHQTIL
jgi:hypothetical protein